MRKHKLFESPDEPHNVHNIRSFRESGSITFLTMGDALFWGATDGSGVNGVDSIYHGDITEIFDDVIYNIKNNEKWSKPDVIAYFQKKLEERGVKYKGDLISALKRFEQVGEDREAGEELFGRYWFSSNTVSFWGPDKMVFDKIKQIYQVLKIIGVSNPETVKWDFEFEAIGKNYDSNPQETLQPDLKKPIGQVTIGDVMKKVLGGKFKAQDDTEEAKLKRKLMIAYHTETDPVKKREIAKKLGMIKPVPNKIGMPQWQADMYRGVAEHMSVYKQMIMETQTIVDNRETLAEVIIKDCGTPSFNSTSLKDFMKDKHLI